MKCQEVANHTADYLTDGLNRATMARIQSHLAECASCRSELEGLGETWARLGVLSEESPGPDSRAKFYAMLEAYPRDLEEMPRRSGIMRWLAHVSLLAAEGSRMTALRAVAAVLIMALGFALGLLVDGRRRDLARMGAELDSMRQQASLSLISQPSAAERLKGVALASQMNHPDPSLVNALFDMVDDDSNVNVRLSAVEALYLFAHHPQIRERLTASLRKQTSPMVQIALIDLLVAVREKHAAEALRQLINNQQVLPEVRQRAQSGIARLL